MNRYLKYIFLTSFILASFIVVAGDAFAQFPDVNVRTYNVGDIITISRSFGGTLLLWGEVLAGITIILSGIMYFFSGGDAQKVNKAKSILKAGLIGALIIFGFGVIVGTIKGFVSNPFQFFE